MINASREFHDLYSKLLNDPVNPSLIGILDIEESSDISLNGNGNVNGNY